MQLRHSVARVDGWLSVATAQDLADGIAWYDRARSEALRMAYIPGCGSVRQAAGVIAALSPRQQWATNVAVAERMIRAAAMRESEPPAAGTLRNRAKAWRIACG